MTITAEVVWAAIVAGSVCLAIGVIWGSWPGDVLRDRETARADRDRATEHGAEIQRENLRLRRELYELRATNQTPGDPQ